MKVRRSKPIGDKVRHSIPLQYTTFEVSKEKKQSSFLSSDTIALTAICNIYFLIFNSQFLIYHGNTI